jgi:hypothetical protein
VEFVFIAPEERNPNTEHHHENNIKMEGMATRLTNQNWSSLEEQRKREGTTKRATPFQEELQYICIWLHFIATAVL